jgi:hypothetical protein
MDNELQLTITSLKYMIQVMENKFALGLRIYNATDVAVLTGAKNIVEFIETKYDAIAA